MKTEDIKVLEFFERKVKESGYSLENIVENKLKSFFNVSRENPYLDKDESKGRYNDLIASSFFPSPNSIKSSNKPIVGNLQLIIECKNLPDHGWIFFGEESSVIPLPEIYTLVNQDSKNNPSFKIAKLFFSDIKYASSYAEFIKSNKTKGKTNSKTSNLYEAIHTVIKATRYQIEVTKEMWNNVPKICNSLNELNIISVVTVFQPLIIFKGFMYYSRLVGEETKLQPIKYIQIRKKYASQHYKEQLGSIHIVSYSALDEYLTTILDFYHKNNNYLLDNQQSLYRQINNEIFGNRFS